MDKREKALQNIEEAERQLEKARANLKDLDKPKLRNGDYGYSSEKSARLYLLDGNKPVHVQSGEAFLGADSWFLGRMDEDSGVVLGNIFDDLQRNSEDLGEYKVDSGQVLIKTKRKLVTISVCGWDNSAHNTLISGHNAQGWNLEPNQAIELGQRIIQIAHEAKRKQ